METLFERHDIYLDDVPMHHVRSMMQAIDWESRLILIKGFRLPLLTTPLH